MVLTDRQWSIGASPYFKDRPETLKKYSTDEQEAQPILRVSDHILPHLGYEVLDTPELADYVFARKA